MYLHKIMSRTYVIINSSDVSSVDFSQVAETSADTLRYSLDGSKTFVKFNGDTPSFLIGEPQYDQEEMLGILNGADWTDPDLDI
jgi:hypothetical protein